MSKESILLTDGYKLDHRRQYPEGTEFVYSNWTPRSCQYFPEANEGTVVFGIAQKLRELDPNVKLSIKITHTIQPLGLRKLLDHYDRIETTNSYKDWFENEKLKVVDVCSKPRILCC